MVPAVAHHFCLNLPATFSEPHTRIIFRPSTHHWTTMPFPANAATNSGLSLWKCYLDRYRQLMQSQPLSRGLGPHLYDVCTEGVTQGRQNQAEVVSNGSIKIHVTWEPPFSRALYAGSWFVECAPLCPFLSSCELSLLAPLHYFLFHWVFMGLLTRPSYLDTGGGKRLTLETTCKVLGPKLMFAERDKHYPSRSGQTSLAAVVINITKPVTKINFRPGSHLP